LWKWNQGPRSILVMRGFLLRITATVQRAFITSGCCIKMARRLTPPEAVNMKMASIKPNMTLWPPNNPDVNPVEYSFWGALQEMIYHCRSFKSVQKLKSAIVAVWQKLSQAFLERTKCQRMAPSPLKRGTL